LIIKENRLKQIIREEVELRIVKQTISEVIVEMQLGLTEEQTILLEKTVLDTIKDAVGGSKYLIAAIALGAFGGEVADNLDVLGGVGVKPAIAQQMQNASDTREFIKVLKDKELQDRVQAAMDRGTAEMGKDVPDAQRREIVDKFISDYSSDITLLKTKSGPITDRMGNLYYYVPYSKIVDKNPTYTDYTTGPEGIDGKRERYQQKSPSALQQIIKPTNINLFAHFGPGKFITVDGPNGPGKLLTPDFSALVQGYLDKAQRRSPEGRAASAEKPDEVMTVTPDPDTQIDPDLVQKTKDRSDRNIAKLQQLRQKRR